MISRHDIKTRAKNLMYQNDNLSGMIGANVLCKVLTFGVTTVLTVFSAVSVALGILFAIPIFGAVVINMMITGPIAIGLLRYYLTIRQKGVNPGALHVFYGFDHFWKLAKVTGYRWFMILIIPCGVVAIALLSLAVLTMEGASLNDVATIFLLIVIAAQVASVFMILRTWCMPWCIAQNPKLTSAQAYKKSCQLTQNHLGELFVYELSFLGWRILDCITFGLVGLLYLEPYYSTASAELYCQLSGETSVTDYHITNYPDSRPVSTPVPVSSPAPVPPPCPPTQPLPIAPRPGLRGITGQYAGQTLYMDVSRDYRVGRSASSDISINFGAEKISRRHCMIRFSRSAQCYQIMDLSRNGVFRNGKRLPCNTTVNLPRGSVIELANSRNSFQLL